MKRLGFVTAWTAALTLALVSVSAAQYFGQNKVQYRSFDWQVLESEHFDVYFYESERNVAVDAARLAERGYTRLSTALDHEFKDKIPLIIYASHTDFQSTNVSPGQIHEGTEGVTELLKRRVFLPFTGSYSEFQHVLEHELVHAFQLDILLGTSESLLTNPMTFIPPLWVMEGMAEYLSNQGVDAHTEMWLRDAALQGYLISIEELTYTPDIRVYRFGQAIMAYIGERFGDHRLAQLLRKSVQARSFPRAVQETLGISLKRLSEDWVQDVRRTYLPTIADHLKPAEFARRLTRGREELSSFNLAVSVDPTGDRFVFISDRSLYNDLYLASAIDGEVDARLIKGERTGNFESLRFFRTAISWSPDGRYLALPASDAGDDVIVIYDVERRREVRRLHVGLDGLLSPNWSPDGQQLVFTGIRDGHPDLYTVDVEGGDLTRLTRSRHAAKDPAWSPDGRYIAFVTDIGPDTDFDRLIVGEFRIGIFDRDTGEVRIPKGQSGKNVNPQWSPDGERLLFVSDRTGISNVFVMDVSGANVRQLTNILTGVTGLTPPAPCISLSRDGSRLLFTSFSQGGFDIFAMDYPLGVPEGDDKAPAPRAWIVDASGLPAPRAGSVESDAPSDVGEDGEVSSEDTAAVFDPIEADGEGVVHLMDAPPAVDDSMPREGDASLAGDLVAVVLGGAEELTAASDAYDEDASATRDTSDTDRDNAVAGFEDAIPLPDSTSFRYRDYRLRFSPDFVAANGLFASNVGLAAQTAIGFSDVLGNHQFVVGASVYGSLLDADLFLSYANLSRRMNWGVSLFQYRSDFVLAVPDDEGDDEYISQIYRGVEFAVSRPFNRFRRVEVGLEFTGIEERQFGSTLLSSYGPTTFIDVPGESGSKFFVRPRAALISDNVVYGGTGPISGQRSRFEIEQAVGGVTFTTLFADVRRYLNLRQRYVLATRLVAASSFGENRQTFRIGGPYTLRGYDFGEVRGSSTLLTNLEFRFPLIDFVKLGWPLPLTFAGIRGLMFFDAGAAWDDPGAFKPIGGQPDRSGFYLNDVRAAFGFGARMNVFGFLIARWDLSRKTDLKSNLGPWKGRLSLGAEF